MTEQYASSKQYERDLNSSNDSLELGPAVSDQQYVLNGFDPAAFEYSENKPFKFVANSTAHLHKQHNQHGASDDIVDDEQEDQSEAFNTAALRQMVEEASVEEAPPTPAPALDRSISEHDPNSFVNSLSKSLSTNSVGRTSSKNTPEAKQPQNPPAPSLQTSQDKVARSQRSSMTGVIDLPGPETSVKSQVLPAAASQRPAAPKAEPINSKDSTTSSPTSAKPGQQRPVKPAKPVTLATPPPQPTATPSTSIPAAPPSTPTRAPLKPTQQAVPPTRQATPTSPPPSAAPSSSSSSQQPKPSQPPFQIPTQIQQPPNSDSNPPPQQRQPSSKPQPAAQTAPVRSQPQPKTQTQPQPQTAAKQAPQNGPQRSRPSSASGRPISALQNPTAAQPHAASQPPQPAFKLPQRSFDEDNPQQVFEESLRTLIEIEALIVEALDLPRGSKLGRAPADMLHQIPPDLLDALEETICVVIAARREMMHGDREGYESSSVRSSVSSTSSYRSASARSAGSTARQPSPSRGRQGVPGELRSNLHLPRFMLEAYSRGSSETSSTAGAGGRRISSASSVSSARSLPPTSRPPPGGYLYQRMATQGQAAKTERLLSGRAEYKNYQERAKAVGRSPVDSAWKQEKARRAQAAPKKRVAQMQHDLAFIEQLRAKHEMHQLQHQQVLQQAEADIGELQRRGTAAETAHKWMYYQDALETRTNLIRQITSIALQ